MQFRFFSGQRHGVVQCVEGTFWLGKARAFSEIGNFNDSGNFMWVFSTQFTCKRKFRFEVRNELSDFFSSSLISAFATRLFSVLRFESVIHEFDPYFNYRTTRFLTEEGFYNFHNWFDDRAWYPLGRIIGGTIYPGLMVTSAALYRFLWLLNITVDIRNVCVFLAPFFSSLTTLVTYLLTKEIHVSHHCLHWIIFHD